MTVKSPTRIDNDARIKMSFARYDEWSYLQEARTEWVNGEVEFKVSVTTVHQDVIQFLIELIRLYVRLFSLGKVSGGPVQARINENSLREPDIFFITQENAHLLTKKRLECPPTLAIEVVSSGSVKLDRHIKLHEYRDAGVIEYWIIDPREGKERADFYRLENSEYVLTGTEDDDRYESLALPGFWINPAWLWATDDAEPMLKLAEITGWDAPEIFERLKQ